MLTSILLGTGVGIYTVTICYWLSLIAYYFHFKSNIIWMVFIAVSILPTILIIFRCFKKVFSFLLKRKEETLITLILLSPQLKSITIGSLEVLDILISIWLILWIIEVMFKEKKIDLTSCEKYHIIILFIFTIMLVSSINGSFSSFIGFFRMSKNGLYYFILTSLILTNKEKFLIKTIKILIITLTISSFIAIIQEVLYLWANIIFVGNISQKTLKLMFEHDTLFGDLLRSPAFFGTPSYLANTLSFTIPLFFIYFIFSPPVNFKNRYLFVMLTSMFVTLFLTYSKGAWIGTTIGIIVGIAILKRKYFFHLLAIGLIGILICWYLGIVDSLIQAMSYEICLGGDLSDRIFLARKTLEKIPSHLLIGRGFDMGAKYTASVMNWPVHNAFIRAFAETGFLGGIAFTGLFCMIFMDLSILLYTVPQRYKILVIAFISGLIGYLIQIQISPLFMSAQFLIIVCGITISSIYVIKEKIILKSVNNYV